ncbi:radical SAM family heme chaperone HemW [Synechococcus sp. CS-602]|uniref:radical SAM family heme chaperone HemW n=1 Tax=Synechococcaceae TaxID=1890426 RepID=UPI0008FF7826|nr:MULTISPECIES: radical SAM family heme chaperone HemW [Synechococcaceae]MCT4365603.1 radical SAM family heme chaperone HemW [Candidatus Regnicoccus frigidus MAG-AL1]APD47404.1 radical SAM protein [Synechococcus sp. SynAce01]MCT0202671.1 radical SAM family heme chaperone HemW [Synechococcus sp. CS-603]MCT0203582.1 radical SAM family heme chaperone HemW [Synechococcus sp. CS-602]MCT0246027.1 radical SAM family heme chaperone HemW [Synechococcus sp. CS-601]
MREPRSAYLHIPFCQRRCFYCDFAVVPLGDKADGAHSNSIAAYLPLLHWEISSAPSGPPLSTVYLGGGTPSLLTPEQIGALLSRLDCQFGLAAGAEISMEMDPASFDQRRLTGVLAAGVNRVSLGGQSFDDAVLETLGRRHRRADLLEAAGWLAQAQRQGSLGSWSLDLIQGLPQQDLNHWHNQLRQAVAVDAPHLSIYDLIVEPGTVFAWRQKRGALPLPDSDLGADLMALTSERLKAAGYGHYEISNYARPGHVSRHNRVYWSGAGWWGFGLGATSAPYGRRLARPRTRAAYGEWLSEATNRATSQAEPGPTPGLTPEQSASELGLPFDELLMVGLRRREGVAMGQIAIDYGLSRRALASLRQRLQPFLEEGLLLIEGDRWRLSDPTGLALSNAVLRELLGWWDERSGPAPTSEAPRSPDHDHRSGPG